MAALKERISVIGLIYLLMVSAFMVVMAQFGYHIM